MTISYSTSMRYWEGTPGSADVKNVWGQALDTNFTLIDQSFNSANAIDVTGLIVYSLTTNNAAPDQARQAMLTFVGALQSACTVTLPNVPRIGWAVNRTTGGFPINLNAGAGADDVLPADGIVRLYLADGSGNISLQNLTQASSSGLNGTSLTITGNAAIGGILAVAGSISTQLSLSAQSAVFNNAQINSTLQAGNISLLGSNNQITVQPSSGLYAFNVNALAHPATTFTCYGGNLGQVGSNYALWSFNGSLIGSITVATGANGVNYNATSDATLKTSRGIIEDVGSLIDRLKPRWFNWNSDPDADPEPGFFAQEVHRVWRWAVTRGRGRKGRKNYMPWQMDNSKLVPLLVAELQQLRRRVADLEAAR